MVWVAVDKDGTERISPEFPERYAVCWSGWDFTIIDIPKGSIWRLLGRELSWKDDPVELTEQTLKPKTQAQSLYDDLIKQKETRGKS